MEEFHVIHDPEHGHWCLSKDVVRLECFSDRADAIERGAELAKRSNRGRLSIHTPDGGLDAVKDYGDAE